MSRAQRDHIIAFRRALHRYRGMNLGAALCRALAVKDARCLRPLPEAEQAEVDWFLAEQPPHPSRRIAGPISRRS